MVFSATSFVSLAFFVILFASVLAQEPPLQTRKGPHNTVPYRARPASLPRHVVRDDDDDDDDDDDSDDEDGYYDEGDSDFGEESDDDSDDKNDKKERKRLRKQEKEARKAYKKAKKHCPAIIAAHRKTIQELDATLAELDNLRNSCVGLDEGRYNLFQRKRALDDREEALDDRETNLKRQANDLMAEEEQLRRRRKALVKKERELEEREANLPMCQSPRRTPKPTPTTVATPPTPSAPTMAGVCEACGSCEAGLECTMGTCQREANDGPQCEMSETCGDGEERVCRELRPTDLTQAGSLKQKLQDQGKFLGNTSRIPGCVDGFVRYDCDDDREVCPPTSSFRFCLQQTEKECEDKGLTEISGDVPTIPALSRTMEQHETGVRQVNFGSPACCTVAVSRSCFEQQVCECRSIV